MSISLDKLYHYIENIAQEAHQNRVIIYRFFPHGSKKIEDLTYIHAYESDWLETIVNASVYCHDQEPLDHEYYANNLVKYDNAWTELLQKINIGSYQPKNLNYRGGNIFAKSLLLHSELRSPEVEKYINEDQMIPVYYWSHAVIARDWFRYAEHETFKKHPKKTFLIYNRAWAGTREYRLKFIDLLIEHELVDHCQTTLNPLDPEHHVHYNSYKFSNPVWKPTRVLENFFKPTQAEASSSADFVTKDYNATDIEVVLETLFDDRRWHLTEKILRPIACGQPFLLVATPGSLQYLRNYGFQTFDKIWNEDYDLIQDPKQRLETIVEVMKEIAAWSAEVKQHKLAQARQIAESNRKRFFSKEFFVQVESELKNNFKKAFDELDSCNNYHKQYTYWKKITLIPEIAEFLNSNQNKFLPRKIDINKIIEISEKRLGITKK